MITLAFVTSLVVTAPPTVDFDALGVHARFRPLFIGGRTASYSLANTTDPHGPDGKTDTATTTIRCRVTQVAVVGDAVTSRVTCEGKRPGGTSLSATQTYVATAIGLWLPTLAPTTTRALAKLTKTPPYLLTTPREWKGTKRKDASQESCTSVIEPREFEVGKERVTAWCRSHECIPDAGYQYGSSRCFADGLGLGLRLGVTRVAARCARPGRCCASFGAFVNQECMRAGRGFASV